MIYVCVIYLFFYRLARDFLRVDYLFLTVGIMGGACTDVEQTFVKVTKFSKREQLLDIVKATGNFFFQSRLCYRFLKFTHDLSLGILRLLTCKYQEIILHFLTIFLLWCYNE